MIHQMSLEITLLLMVPALLTSISSQQCGIDTYSVYQMMLRGHTFKTLKARPYSLDCRKACLSDVRCQSYNYVMFKAICELNNRTKEARPEDFVKDSDRYYVTKTPKRGKKNSKNYVPVTSQLQHSPPGSPPGIWIFEKFLFKFPPHRALKLFKCPHPQENTQITVLTFH